MKFRSKKLCHSLNYPQNDFLDNYLDADLQNYLIPINLVQYVLFSPKYTIRNNFITSNNRTINYISLIIAFCFIISYIIIITFDDHIKDFEKLLLIIFILKYFLYCVGCGLTSILNIIQSDIHVILILTIQKLKKSFKFITIDNKSIISSWIYVLMLCLFYFAYYLLCIIKKKLTLTMILTYLLLLLADLNIVYMLRILKLLRNYVVLWTSEMKQFNTMVINKDRENELGFWQTKVSVLKRILDASYICKELCEFPVLYYIVVTFMQSLGNFQALIVFPDIRLYTFILFIWTLKNTTLLFLISFEREKLFIALKNIEVVLIMATVADVSPDERLVYKTLRRLNRATYKMMKSNSMVTVDAALPLRIISVLVTYIIALLQFAFL